MKEFQKTQAKDIWDFCIIYFQSLQTDAYKNRIGRYIDLYDWMFMEGEGRGISTLILQSMLAVFLGIYTVVLRYIGVIEILIFSGV